MGHLILQGGEELAKRIKDELEDKATPANWDTLAAATWAIYGFALQVGGLYLMTCKEDGSAYCPLCEAEVRAGAGTAVEWITGCLDAQLKYAREQGLMPKE